MVRFNVFKGHNTFAGIGFDISLLSAEKWGEIRVFDVFNTISAEKQNPHLTAVLYGKRAYYGNVRKNRKSKA